MTARSAPDRHTPRLEAVNNLVRDNARHGCLVAEVPLPGSSDGIESNQEAYDFAQRIAAGPELLDAFQDLLHFAAPYLTAERYEHFLAVGLKAAVR